MHCVDMPQNKPQGVGGGGDINVLDVSAMALYHVCFLTVLSSFHIYVCTWYRIYALVFRGRRLASCQPQEKYFYQDLSFPWSFVGEII